MNNEDVQYQFYHTNAILVVNTKGLIRVLYTPFRVLCIVASGRIPQNTWVYVEEVYSNQQDELQYLVYGTVHSFRHFKILIAY